MLYAAVGDSDNNPTEEGEGEEGEGKKAGRGRMEDTCTDEYLLERGVKPKKNRYYFKVDDWAENDIVFLLCTYILRGGGGREGG